MKWMEQPGTATMSQRTSKLVGMALLCVLLWFTFPIVAEWTADRVPFAHLVLLPGGSPTLATVTLIWATLALLVGQFEPPVRWWKLLAKVIGMALAIGWVYVLGYWLLIALNGGV